MFNEFIRVLYLYNILWLSHIRLYFLDTMSYKYILQVMSLKINTIYHEILLIGLVKYFLSIFGEKSISLFQVNFT